MTVIPGYVNTKMTKDINLPKWLTISPEYVGLKIYNAHLKEKIFCMCLVLEDDNDND